jgi:mycofactocin precursor
MSTDTTGITGAAAETEAAEETEETKETEELLIEEISIDGMCGVY